MSYNKSRIIKYLLVGLTSLFVELSFLFFLHNILNLSSLSSVALSFWVGFFTTFFLQKLYTFKSSDRSGSRLGYELVLYCGLVLVNYLFTLVFVGIITAVMGVFLARILALSVTTTWNYFAYKFIFKK